MAAPRFIFRLEPLLDLRKRAERACQLRVAVIQSQANAHKTKIQQLQADIAAENRQMTETHLVGVLDMALIAQSKRYVAGLQSVIHATVQKLAGVERELAAARVELLAAARARKAIEKLREKHFQRWRAELDRKENADLDEIGTQLAIRHMIDQPDQPPAAVSASSL